MRLKSVSAQACQSMPLAGVRWSASSVCASAGTAMVARSAERAAIQPALFRFLVMSTSSVVCLGLCGFEALFGVLREEAGPGGTAMLTELWAVPEP